MTVDEHEAPPPEQRRRAPGGWAGVRPLLMRLHFYAGVLVAPFLLVAALSGLAYIYTPQLEQVVHDHELHVPAAAASVPLSRQVELARQEVPEGKLVSVRPGATPTDSTQVVFHLPDAGSSFNQTVFVNPHDGEIRGSLETYGSSQALPVRAWLSGLHRNLHLGEFGRLYSELAASWLGVLVLVGLGLWVGRRGVLRRIARRDNPAAGPAAKRGRTVSRHATVGVWAAIGLLFLSATGLTWSAYAGENVSDLRTALDWTTPSVTSAVDPSPTGADVGIDAVRAATAAAGLADPVEIRVPAAAGKAYVVTQVQKGLPGKSDSMAVDPATGQVTDTLRFADYPLMAKLTKWGIDAHMGMLFGLPNQIVLTALALAIIGLVVWGYRMWWLRRPPLGANRFGKAPPRGTWRRASPTVLVPLVVVGGLLAWFLPVFGVSLVAFLVVDALVAFSTKEEPTKTG
ncbi:putative iron-regulated membrane protein [Actinokineospora spheciospongiae]|uniref:Putative iron-regulated membrane protein n=1 Tax=Actinokineospora spheciospongiae TaxID=909613 RepID=W7IQD2_9PSEU|nr:PepSY-associated TM helix domain-containing protein [Actinokineospora spheciospongiae]EWC62593.1 putative iron-regulated membrane protein [Actinokineospora spheciospongiae]